MVLRQAISQNEANHLGRQIIKTIVNGYVIYCYFPTMQAVSFVDSVGVFQIPLDFSSGGGVMYGTKA